MRKRTHLARIALACVVAAAGLGAGGLAAQPYPARIIRVINPAAPGGNVDFVFRLLAPKMGEILGQQLVIDYRPGAGGNIGAEIAAKSAPDGYTTLIAAAGFVVSSGFSFLGPAGLPRPIVDKLNSALVQALRDTAIRKMLIERGADPVGNTPAEHAAYIKSEVEKWQRVARAAGITPE